ncbi:MAG: ThuA domain-containing protein [Planctomycetes bacterium]|nr:ThuA domain-containing protein [Planctomycetota bacterium]
MALARPASIRRLALLAPALLCGALLGAQDQPAPGALPVLLIGGQNNHDWKLTNAFLMELFHATPGLAAVEDDTPPADAPPAAWDAWHPQFAKYRCVVLDYNGQMWPDAVKKDFEAYIAGGGGALVLHAANNSFTGWTEYEKMVGLLWRDQKYGASLYVDAQGTVVREEAGQGRGMGHGAQYDWQLTIRDAAHPITAGMPDHWLHIKDELYHGQRGPAQDVHILMTAHSDPGKGGTGKDEPIVWWVPYGKGKVVTDVMGHVGETATLSCVGYQTTVLRSIAWLATGACATPIPKDFPTPERTTQRYPGGPARSLDPEMTAAESLARFKLPPGYHIELVASDPTIINPVACSWDGDGRLYVAEMRTYMLDADAKGENEPRSRVSRLVDSKGTGVYDQATAFADGLVLPRMVLALGKRVIIAETYTGKFVSYGDKDGDGVADDKIEVFDGGRSNGNLEHQDSALQWSLDNRLYTALVGSRRFRIAADGHWDSEPLYGRGSQWGLAIDDLGRTYSSAAGGENGAFGFQQLPAYGALELEGEQGEGFTEVYPRLQTVDVQGGLGRVNPLRGTLNHLTGCAGQSIFRGDRLPADLAGDYILPEPVGRLVRRAKIQVQDGKRVLVNAYDHDEFITSTDPSFRPVWSATGPDGCLYICDLHHGIIQEGAWTNPGSYLRGIIDRDGHAKYIGHGRIYRVVADGFKPGPQPRLLERKAADLVQFLGHPNGWWRDTAQQLIVLSGDQSVVPELQRLVRAGAAPLGRMHALWALDGLGASDHDLLVAACKDADWRVRCAAVRIGEALLAKGDAAFLAALTPLAADPVIDVVVQVVDSLRFVTAPEGKLLLAAIAAKHVGNEIVTASAQQSLRYDPAHPTPINVKLDAKSMALAKKGYEHYTQLCFACHGLDGKGVTSNDGQRMAPPLSGSARVQGSADAVTRIVLDGLTGEIDGKTYVGLMVPMKANDDQWLAEVLTYVRSSFGNSAPAITAEDVKRIRATTASRTQPYTLVELKDFLPLSAEVLKGWTYSASLNSGAAGQAADGNRDTRWDTGAGQAAGQWFQIDMAKPHALYRLVLDAEPSTNDYPRGWEVRLSDDGTTWSEPVATGEGKAAVTDIALPGKAARYLRVVQTASGKTGLYWSIHELKAYAKEQGK